MYRHLDFYRNQEFLNKLEIFLNSAIGSNKLGKSVSSSWQINQAGSLIEQGFMALGLLGSYPHRRVTPSSFQQSNDASMSYSSEISIKQEMQIMVESSPDLLEISFNSRTDSYYNCSE